MDDEGPGISAELLPRLFQPFEQEGAWQPRAQGTGLGLAICRQLMEQMGARSGSNLWPAGQPFPLFLALRHAQEKAPWQPRVKTVSLQLLPGELEYAGLARSVWRGRGSGGTLPWGHAGRWGLRAWYWQGEPWIRARGQPAAAQTRPWRRGDHGPAGAGRRVLLVEDHEVNRMLISMQLGQLGAWY